MTQTLTIEEVRGFIAATNRQIERFGIFIDRVRLKRDDTGAVQEIYIDYEERTETDDDTDGNQSTNGNRD